MSAASPQPAVPVPVPSKSAAAEPKPLAGIHERLAAIKEILLLLLDLRKLLVSHWRFFALVVAAVLAYAALVYFSFDYHGRTIESFYGAVEQAAMARARGEPADKYYVSAWSKLSPQIRAQKWSNDIEAFKGGFSTTASYDTITVSCPQRTWNPWGIYRAVFSPRLEYEVSFTVRDRFTADDLKQEPDERTRYNHLWVQAAHFKTYDAFVKGEYKDPTGNANPRLELTRAYKKRIGVSHDSDWLITYIEDSEVTVIFKPQ